MSETLCDVFMERVLDVDAIFGRVDVRRVAGLLGPALPVRACPPCLVCLCPCCLLWVFSSCLRTAPSRAPNLSASHALVHAHIMECVCSIRLGHLVPEQAAGLMAMGMRQGACAFDLETTTG